MILVLVPVFFEFCCVAILSFLLLHTEEKLEELKRAKEIVLTVHRAENSTIHTVLLLGTDTDSSVADKLSQLLELQSRFDKPHVIAGMTAQQFPELTEAAEEIELLRPSLQKYIERAIQILTNPARSELEQRQDYNQFIDQQHTAILSLFIGLAPLSRQLEEIEHKIDIAQPEEMKQTQFNLFVLLIAAVILSVFISLKLDRIFSEDILRRLQVITNNASLLASARQIPPPQKQEHDELAEVERALYESSELLTFARHKELAILDNAASIICSLDSRLKFVDVNVTAHRILQHSIDDLLGLSLLNLLRSDTVANVRSQFEEFADASEEGEVETLMRRKDGTFVTCLWKVRWSKEKRIYFCVVHDITELRSVERLKQRVISIVSHDLRAPLTAVGINLELLSQGKHGELADGVRKELDKTEKSLTRLMQLVNDLLELERFGVGKVSLDLTAVSAATVLTEAKEALSALASRYNVTVKGPVGDAAVLGDERRLIQAATNLLSNAIKYSPSGGTVTLSLFNQNNLVELRIKDEGPGIPLEEQVLIFDKFHQVKTNVQVAADMKSTGLGLAIVQAIASQHQGECGVESEPGKGSTFWIRVPEFIDPEEESA